MVTRCFFLATQGVTNGRDRLDASVGREVSYAAAPASRDGAPLNPHHTHFILVDNGKEGGAAHEVDAVGGGGLP